MKYQKYIYDWIYFWDMLFFKQLTRVYITFKASFSNQNISKYSNTMCNKIFFIIFCF